MEATKRKRSGARDSPELRVVAIHCKPAPDAEARLRRIAAILLDHAMRAAPQVGDGDGDGTEDR